MTYHTALNSSLADAKRVFRFGVFNSACANTTVLPAGDPTLCFASIHTSASCYIAPPASANMDDKGNNANGGHSKDGSMQAALPVRVAQRIVRWAAL